VTGVSGAGPDVTATTFDGNSSSTNEGKVDDDHGFSTNLLSTEWLSYILKQLDSNIES
jgi:hypothetical protein